ncbi:hypothetical protein [Candidatus Lariskella endosymbiont of Epinotia ramella]|uniref:M61 family metallopeptidase n=1 Tax=Candidatus Lariskella endosymbiont of Epinotia ramella TaxID=3066224 RepID=UPI0030D07CEF
MALALLIGATCIYFASFANIEALAKQANQISLEKEMQVAGNSKTDKSNLSSSPKKPKASSKVVNYKISTKDDLSAFLIDVKFQGHSSGKTLIYIPALSGIEYEQSSFSAISDKKNLKIERVKGNKCMRSFPYHCESLLIHHKPNADVIISYQAEHTAVSFASQNSIIFRGSGVLLYPELDKNQPSKIVIDSKALGKKSAKMMSGASAYDMSEEMPTKLENLFSSFYIFTDLDINISPHDKEAGALIVTVGLPKEALKDSQDDDSTSLSHQYITSLTRKILGFNAKFIDGILGKYKTDEIKAVLITQDSSASSIFMGSDGVNTGDAIFISNLENLKTLISHESIHSLFRNRGFFAEFGPNMQFNHLWFAEGFTDYYTSLLNYRNGIITEQEYIDNINKSIEEYYKRDRIFQKIVSAPYSKKTRIVEQILLGSGYTARAFYNSGQLVAMDDAGRLIAMNMDYMIRTKSSGKFSLDDFLRNLVKSHCKGASCNVSREQFYSEFAKLLGQEFEDKERKDGLYSYMDRYIIDFAPISPPDTIPELNRALSYKRIDNAICQFGFDIDRSFLMGLISGVDENSNAYKAGLRNGMKRIYFMLGGAKNDLKDFEVKIEIENPDHSKQSIKYSALGEIMLPYYK